VEPQPANNKEVVIKSGNKILGVTEKTLLGLTI
ncbi:MAG: hypothetical protein RL008_360, partial [Actinomycetota bacterium]